MRILTLLLIVTTSTSSAQKKDIPSDHFSIVGQIEKEIEFSIEDMKSFEKHKLEDVVITNHLGYKKGTTKNLTGILIKDLLNEIKFKADNPKLLSEFYLTFVATDGYKVVYSWNEIFNTKTGDNIYLITEKEGKKINEMEERILVITTTDFKTGRRNIKGLSKIIVGRVM